MLQQRHTFYKRIVANVTICFDKFEVSVAILHNFGTLMSYSNRKIHKLDAVALFLVKWLLWPIELCVGSHIRESACIGFERKK